MSLALYRKLALTFVGLFVVAQLVPYGRSHENPQTAHEPSWDSPRTRLLASRACFDCHSHETRWPWYTHVAPASWLAQAHVDEGRHKLNFSAFESGSTKAAREAAEAVREGFMPLPSYLWLHPEAALTPAEKRELEQGLLKSLRAPR
jgi:hypothetical protein